MYLNVNLLAQYCKRNAGLLSNSVANSLAYHQLKPNIKPDTLLALGLVAYYTGYRFISTFWAKCQRQRSELATAL